MRVRVDGSRCQGHTLCAMIAPDSFELDDVDGHAHAATDVVAGEQHDAVAEAAKSCPEQAIEIVVEASDRSRAVRNGAAQ
ncbi:ferredoxin [Mycobacterium sp. 050128]|uniref:ferredoxin n=1 Tax=Mycobacterium sp. 050128 TaxID=3096112 RepID=UPI002ED9F862